MNAIIAVMFKDKDEFVQRVGKIIIGAIKSVLDAHGEIIVSSVAKRVACQLWTEYKEIQKSQNP